MQVVPTPSEEHSSLTVIVPGVEWEGGCPRLSKARTVTDKVLPLSPLNTPAVVTSPSASTTKGAFGVTMANCTMLPFSAVSRSVAYMNTETVSALVSANGDTVTPSISTQQCSETHLLIGTLSAPLFALSLHNRD